LGLQRFEWDGLLKSNRRRDEGVDRQVLDFLDAKLRGGY